MKRTFASDNYAGVHPEIMDALIRANTGHAGSYGSDDYTARAVGKFREYFGDDIEVFMVYNGTAANVLGLSTLTRSFNSIICSSLAHIHVDESTAPEKFTGCKLVTIATEDGKIYPPQISECVRRIGDQHHPQAKVISISQSSEYGTVYSIDEIMAISQVAKKNGLFLHMDGSRIANAAVSLGKDLRAFTRDAGVDVLSFGGTKNGMMFGEAILFFTPGLAENFQYIRKQGMQLHSKMRFISAQFEALLSNDLWKRNATHANMMARLLSAEISRIEKTKINQRVEGNGIFVSLPPAIVPALQESYFFYMWDDAKEEARLMCSFDTTEEDIADFIKTLRELLKR